MTSWKKLCVTEKSITELNWNSTRRLTDSRKTKIASLDLYAFPDEEQKTSQVTFPSQFNIQDFLPSSEISPESEILCMK